MTGAIVDLSSAPAPAELTVDVCVIGSGCGGATAARLLAEAGREVVVLEEGRDYTGRALLWSDADGYDQLYMDRGGRSTEDLSITVLQGRVLGGGGTINMCDVVPIPAPVLEFWRRRHGLTDLTEEALRPHAEAALADLSASRPREDQVNRANKLLRSGAQALDLRGEVMRHNRERCAGLGTCLTGCPVDAKRNPRFVAVPAAIRAGARFFTRARAVGIEDAGQELKRVQVRTLDARGYQEQGAFELKARRVIVAANAVASAQLLRRSAIGNEHVGRHLMLQPQLPIMADFPDPVEGYYGIPQSYAVTEHEQLDNARYGLWGFRIEGVMGTPGIVASLLPVAGVRGKELMTRYPYLAASLLLAPDEPSGEVALTESGRPRIRYDHKDNHKARLREAAQVAARAYLAAGATSVMIPTVPPVVITSVGEVPKAAELSLRPASAPILSAHQQGSVRMSPDSTRGAADPDGQVYGTRDVYVFDSSGFPSSASSHTMAPIITMSRYLTTRLLARS